MPPAVEELVKYAVRMARPLLTPASRASTPNFCEMCVYYIRHVELEGLSPRLEVGGRLSSAPRAGGGERRAGIDDDDIRGVLQPLGSPSKRVASLQRACETLEKETRFIVVDKKGIISWKLPKAPQNEPPRSSKVTQKKTPIYQLRFLLARGFSTFLPSPVSRSRKLPGGL